jgi:acetyltransferase-like isoleucine patch superfamily enzyme
MIDLRMHHSSKAQATTYYAQQKELISVDVHSYLGDIRIICYDLGHRISVGKYCSIANDTEFTLVTDHSTRLNTTFPMQVIWPDLENYCAERESCFRTSSAKDVNIHIGHDVWIGRSASILSGVTIGHGAVIGAGCAVTKDIPPYAVAVGNPCKIIKYRFEDARIAQLLEMAWWNWPEASLKEGIEHLLSDQTDGLYKFYLAHNKFV